MENPHIEEVIRTSMERRGSGKNKTSPIRCISQVFAKDGTLIMENDPSAIVLTPEMQYGLKTKLVAMMPFQTPDQLEDAITAFFSGNGPS